MTVLKKFEPRTGDIKQLEWILDQLTTEQEDIKRRVLIDLKRIRGGDRGKFNASNFIEQLFADRDDVVLLHDLKFKQGDLESQVDHLVVSTDGTAYLFETKNFSNGLKVSNEGQFAYWNRFKRSFYSINSPIENAEKNKQVLNQLLKSSLKAPLAFKHFILVDHRAKLIKPELGFEMIVRSDEIASLISKDLKTSSGLFETLKRLFGLTSSVSSEQLKESLSCLLTAHQNSDLNYIEKYGLNLNYDSSSVVETSSSEPQNYSSEPRLQRLTLAKLAREMAIHPQELQARLTEQGLLEKRGFKTFVSDKGRDAGIQFRKGQRGVFFLIPTEMAKDPSLLIPAQATTADDSDNQ